MRINLILTILLLFTCELVFADDYPILNGRLIGTLPENSTSLSNDYDNLMGTKQSIKLNISDITINIEASELICYASENMDSLLNKYMISWSKDEIKYSFETMKVNDLIVYKITPSEFIVNKGTIFLNRFYIVNTDKTIQQLEVLSDENFEKYKDTCLIVVDGFINTLKSGTRKLEIFQRTDTLETRFGKFQLELPDNYLITYKKGIDFDVTKIYKVDYFDRPSSSILFYLGHHPNTKLTPKVKQYGKLFTKKSYFLGIKSKVKIFISSDGKRIIQERLTQIDENDKYLKGHVLIDSGDIESLNELVAITKSIKKIE